MHIMVFLIAIINILIIYEAMRSKIWKSKRRSVDGLKSVFMTSLVAAGFMIFSCYAMLSVEEKIPDNDSFHLLITTAMLVQTLANHQFVYILNRRKIIRDRRSENVKRRAC